MTNETKDKCESLCKLSREYVYRRINSLGTVICGLSNLYLCCLHVSYEIEVEYDINIFDESIIIYVNSDAGL